MADPEVRISFGEETGDVEMQGGDGGDVEVAETAAANGGNVENGNEDESAGPEGKIAQRTTFIEYASHAVVMLASCHFS